MMFEPWQLGMIDEAGYNGIRDEHIEKVADSLLSTGLTELTEVHSKAIVANAASTPITSPNQT